MGTNYSLEEDLLELEPSEEKNERISLKRRHSMQQICSQGI